MQFAVITLLVATTMAFVAYVGTWVLTRREHPASRLEDPPTSPPTSDRPEQQTAPRQTSLVVSELDR